jgi:signal transduction histidine kinase
MTGRPAPRRLAAMLKNAFEALDHLAGGLGTAVLALATVACWLVVGTASVFWIGLPLLPAVLAMTRAVADRERARLGRWGEPVLSPYQTAIEDLGRRDALRAARRDPATWRDLRWLALHATAGLVLGLFGIALPVMAVRDITFPLWYGVLPEGETGPMYLPLTPMGILGTVLIGMVWVLLSVTLGPAMARLQALPGRRLLAPHPSVDLSHRIAELTATRAGALAAHAAELRRIERSLHDGAQNRLVAVVVMVAAARRALERDPASAGPALDRAQQAAEAALGELRGVVRGILPPILHDRGLAGALTALAADCPVPCRVSVGDLGAVPLSVETTAYFTVAEALTNVARHSGAAHARVALERRDGALRVEIEDDGRGGADEEKGSGLTGIRRRVAAHDGVLTVTSPSGGPTRIEVELPCVS